MSSQLPERVGRYEVVERLGTGGMGVVYLATDPLLRRTVAVKVLPGDNEDLRERFAREARSAAGLRHNNIVTIYDVGEEDGQPFIAMEFIDGESMAELIRRRAQLTIPSRLQLMVELCAGLGYAHRNGIVHRDIKPANLMITSEGGLKVLDFGLAKVMTEPTLGSLTGVGILLGTPHYLSPEQIGGTAGDRTSDIFSVGLVLYELLSYRKAFPGDSAPAILFDVVEKEPTPIRELVPDIDEELEGIVKQAIEKDRARRYPDLGVLGSALEHVRARIARSPDDSVVPKRPRRKPGALTDRPNTADSAAAPRLDAIAQRRTAKIAEHLTAAAAQLQAGQPEAAIEHCEHALLIDPDDEQGLDLLRQAHRALEDRQVQGWIDEAKERLQRGALTEAEELIEQSLRARGDRPEIVSLQEELKERRRERERQAERQRSAQAAVERATRNMESGAFEAAIRCASEALAYDPEHAEARDLRERAHALLAEHRRQLERDAAARELAAQARELAGQQHPHEALALLGAFVPQHPLVTELIADLESQIAAERERQDAEQRQHDADARVPESIAADAAPAATVRDRRAAQTPTEAPVADAPRMPERAQHESVATSDIPPIVSETPIAPAVGPLVTPSITAQQGRDVRLLFAVSVIFGLGLGIWLLLPQQASPPPSVVSDAGPPPATIDQTVAQQNAERYRQLLQQADQRLAAQDADGATAAILEAEKILPGDSRLAELKNQVETVRATVQQLQQQRADIDGALGQAAKMADDTEAIARLQRELAKYPGTAALSEAIDARREARDNRIADLLRRAQSVPDAMAVPLLQEALGYNSSRADIRRELDRRRASLAASAKPRSRAEVENEVRRTLYAFQSAYASRSVDDFLKLAPFRTRAQIENEFKSFRSIQMNIEGVTIDVDASATRASVRCTISTVSMPVEPNARPMTDKRAWQFQLAYGNGMWQITGASPR